MFIKLYLIAFSVFLALDLVWLGLVSKKFYARQIGFLMKTDISWLPAVIFYLLFTFGLVVFIIAPSLEKGSLTYALLYGALFGLITYATYDLTNLATLKGWPILVTIVDLLWGTAVSALVSLITFLLANKIT